MAGTLAVATLGLLAAGPAAAEPQYPAPARPILESRGHRLTAAQGSSCWRVLKEDGSGVGVCADAAPQPTTKRRLRVRSWGVVRIDMGIPVTKLYASLPGGRPLPHLRRLDADGRHWRLRLPQHFRRTTVLSLGAYYAQGDASFGASLRHVKRPRG